MRLQFYSRGGNFLRDDISCFDAPFFSLTAAEASALDPQQRHLLEVTYRALENGRSMLSLICIAYSLHLFK